MKRTGKHLIRLALAEDHKLVRDGICSILKASGHFDIVIEAANGVELIDALKKVKVLPEICVLDINMPDMDGYETIEAVRSQWPAMKFLTLTMYRNEYAVVKMLRLGTNGYLLKSSSHTELINALLAIYHSGKYDSELALKYKRQIVNSLEIQFPTVTDRELKFLSYCCSDMRYKEIADKMHVSARTVEGYRNDLFNKLNIKTRTGLAMYAMNAGIAPDA
jgi:two-component system, NarL family, invasion response regulator UvrY